MNTQVSETIMDQKIALKTQRMLKKQRHLWSSVSLIALSACGSNEKVEAVQDHTDTALPEIIPTQVVDPASPSIVGTPEGEDIILGSDVGDYIRVLAGNDTVYGGKGNDSIWGDGGNDVIFGEDGNDTIRGGDGDDKIYGGAGDDIIYLSPGNDLEDGGAGNDTIKITSDNSTIPITFDLLLGQYYFTAQSSSSLINLVSIENIDSVSAASTTVKDTPTANIITTGRGDDIIISLGGSDVISTGAGNDSVYLATGAYNVDLGSGNDTLYLPLSSAVLEGGTGTDTVVAREEDGQESVYIHLQDEFYFIDDLGYAQDGLDKSLESFENVLISGSVNSTIIGSSGSNVITGSDGNDTIFGGAGDDSIAGGSAADIIDAEGGADTVTGGSDNDTFIQSLGDSIAATAQVIGVSGAIAAEDTITFANGIDIYMDFSSGNESETIDTDNAGTTLLSLIGQSELTLTDNVLLFASGNYDTETKIFTIKADGVGADTLMIDVDNTNSDVSDVLSTSTSMFLLQGVVSDTLVAGDFV